MSSRCVGLWTRLRHGVSVLVALVVVLTAVEASIAREPHFLEANGSSILLAHTMLAGYGCLSGPEGAACAPNSGVGACCGLHVMALPSNLACSAGMTCVPSLVPFGDESVGPDPAIAGPERPPKLQVRV